MAAGSRSRRDALRLSDQQTLRFLTLYEGEPVLWNQFLEQYRNRDSRAEAAARIARTMDVEGFGPEQVVTKFKNLRSSYCQELKKIAASESSGASRTEVYSPQVVWFSKMDSFLKPHVTSRSSNANTNFLFPVVEFESSEADNSVSEDGTCWDRSSPVNGVDVPEPYLSLVKKEPGTSPVNHPKKPKLGETTDRDRGHEDDTLDQFGKYLTSLLRALPRQRAFRLQQQIINLAIAANIENDG